MTSQKIGQPRSPPGSMIDDHPVAAAERTDLVRALPRAGQLAPAFGHALVGKVALLGLHARRKQIERDFTVPMLRALAADPDLQPRWPVDHPHGAFSHVAVLTARPGSAGDFDGHVLGTQGEMTLGLHFECNDRDGG